MLTLNLRNQNKTDINFSISHFPDGEVQITLGEFDRKEHIHVECRITNAEDLFILMQVNDILTRHAVMWNLEIFYLMGMRMDRVMDFNRPFTLSVITNILNNFSCINIRVLEPHSEVTGFLLDCCSFGCRNSLPDGIVVFPDKGASSRYRLKYPDNICITCDKVRDISTGKIIDFKINNEELVKSNEEFTIVDDLCDAGGTFCAVADAIRKINPDAKLHISVVHMVNPKGIENLSKNFDTVTFTDSYKDWRSENLPKNVTQINV